MQHDQPTTNSAPFSEVEIQHLQRDDIEAARVVAGLMTIIFLIGLVLYAAITYLVSP